MNALKQLVTKPQATSAVQATSRSAVRKFHSTRPTFGGDHAPDYVHAPKMYKIQSIKNRKLKFGLFIGGGAVLGFGIPFAAVKFSNSKMG
jgi:hypothetical protein